MAQRTTMAQTWWPRSSDYATCSTTREADSTTVTDLRDIDTLSRAPQPCARFISTIINSLSASSNPTYTLLTDYTKGRRPTTTSRRVGSLFPLVTRLIVYIMIINTSIYGNSKIQGEGGARPQGLCHTTLRTPSRRSVEPVAGGLEFVALKLETGTGGSTRRWYHLSRERFDALHGNTHAQRRRIYAHVDCTSRKPSNVIDVSQPGGLRKIVKERLGRHRAALVASEEAWGTRLDAIGATRCWVQAGLCTASGVAEVRQMFNIAWLQTCHVPVCSFCSHCEPLVALQKMGSDICHQEHRGIVVISAAAGFLNLVLLRLLYTEPTFGRFCMHGANEDVKENHAFCVFWKHGSEELSSVSGAVTDGGVKV